MSCSNGCHLYLKHCRGQPCWKWRVVDAIQMTVFIERLIAWGICLVSERAKSVIIQSALPTRQDVLSQGLEGHDGPFHDNAEEGERWPASLRLFVSRICLEFCPAYTHVVHRPRPTYVHRVPTTPFKDQMVNLNPSCRGRPSLILSMSSACRAHLFGPHREFQKL